MNIKPMTPEELQKFNKLEEQVRHLTDIIYRTKFVDKDVFSNPVYFNGGFVFKSPISIGITGNKVGFLGATPIVRQSAISAPSGGATVDAEARTAINLIRAVLTNFGFTS